MTRLLAMVQHVADRLQGEVDVEAALRAVADLLVEGLGADDDAGVRIRIEGSTAVAGVLVGEDPVIATPVTVQGEVVGEIELRHGVDDATAPAVATTLDGVAAQLGTWWALARADREHRRDLDRITQLMETAPVGLALVDATGTVRFANATALRLVDADGIDDFPWAFGAEHVPWGDPALAAVADVRRTGSPVRDVRVALQEEDGIERVLAVNASPLAPGPDGTRGMAISISDVTTERRRAVLLESALDREQRSAHELRRVSDLKDGFLRALSHELRTPLAAIVGFVETLRDHQDLIDQDQTASMLDRLQANAQRLGLMVEDLLDVGRITAGVRSTTNRTQHDLDEVVRAIVELLPHEDHHIELDLETTPAFVDRPKAERIVHNLVGNALRHTPAGTKIRVHTHQEEDGDVVLVVEDDGPGIPDDERSMVFEPFVQGELAAAAANPGTGVGLSLVRQFVELHGGTVSVDSAPAGGARFTVVLPDAE